jgi:hypothetical protein
VLEHQPAVPVEMIGEPDAVGSGEELLQPDVAVVEPVLAEVGGAPESSSPSSMVVS